MDQHNLPMSVSPDPRKGLPPVTPPSGRFIAQLFLVPGTIVLLAVLLLLAFRYLLGGAYTPDSFLRQLDSDNADIRWRGASDLAQHIKRPESKMLKADVNFALDLAERLRNALDELDQDEAALAAKIAKLPPADQDKAWRKLAPQRDFVEYLASALGDFYAPVGVPLLCEIINRENAVDVKGNTMRRRRGIWALSNLGAHVQVLGTELSSAQQAKIMDGLQQAMDGADPQRRVWALNAVYYLDKTAVAKDTAGLVLVDHALAQCAKSQDRFLRLHVAMAFNFWDGDIAEPTLLTLAQDDGFGTLIRIEDKD